MHRSIRMGLAVAAVACVVPASASAHFSHAHVATLKARVAAITPTAQAQVQAAAAQGPAALAALSRHVMAMPMAGPNQTTPQQYALAQALAPYVSAHQTETDVNPAVAPPDTLPYSGSAGLLGMSTSAAPAIRHSSGPIAKAASACWYVGNHIWSIGHYTEAGINVGSLEKDHGYWCGDGYSITQNGVSGFYSKGPNTTPPYCQVVINNDQGWDGPHSSWAHGRMSTHFGSWTPWVTCATFTGDTVVVRIAASGYHDGYNDY